MKRDNSAASSSDVSKPDSGKAIWLSLIDTTWRMFVPIMLFAGLGWLLDTKLDTEPVMYVVGAFVGLFFAVILVRRQIVNVNRLNNQGGKDV